MRIISRDTIVICTDIVMQIDGMTFDNINNYSDYNN